MEKDRKWILLGIVACCVLALAWPVYAELAGSGKVGLRSSEWEICEKMKDSGDIILLPNPGDCRAYYECDNGIPVPRVCPEGLYYCFEHQICTWVWEPGCTFPCDLPNK